jgi:hypothetical protein
MKLVGFSGFSCAGKDTAVAGLVSKGWTRISFADKLREFCYAMNPVVWDDEHEASRHLAEVIDADAEGWDGYKTSGWGVGIREYLQHTGQAAREIFGENFWVEQAFAKLDPKGKYAVSDCRYQSEMAAVKQHGGISVRIARPGVVAVNDHISEHDLDDYPFDICVLNDMTEGLFQVKIVTMFDTD